MVTVAISCYRGPTHRDGKSGGDLVTLFDSYSYDGVIAAIGVQHTSPESGGGLVTHFDNWMLFYPFQKGASLTVRNRHQLAP